MIQDPSRPFISLASPNRLWGASQPDAEVLSAHPRRVLADLLRLFLANQTPITLWGPVGSRKTRTIQALEQEKDSNGVPYQVITIQPSTEDPTIIHGMRYTTKTPDGATVMLQSIPDVVKRIIEYHQQSGGHTILFLDEMTTCMPSQQHALLGLLTHGQYGPENIHDYNTIGMAANPLGTVSTVNDLGEQVMNRGGHIPWYGDVTIFLDEWSSGFGRVDRAPDGYVIWFIDGLLRTMPDKAFRSATGAWDPETLVPWDRFEHSERTTTELGRMTDLVNKVFATSPRNVRHHYLIEVTRALMGNEWANSASDVLASEGDQLTAERVVAVMSDAAINTGSDIESVQNAIGGLHLSDATGAPITHAQRLSVMHDLVRKAGAGANEFQADYWLAGWAFLVSAPSEGDIMGLHEQAVSLLMLSQNGLKAGLLDSRSAIPGFVPKELAGLVVESVRRAVVRNQEMMTS